MATSGTSAYVTTRDLVIARALRICGAIGQNETPAAAAVTEANQCINDLVKEWQADGMQLWRQQTSNFSMVAGTGSYQIGTGATINQVAPLKIMYMWNRTVATGADAPMNQFTKGDYDRYNSKLTQGAPTQWFYQTPGPSVGAMVGTLYLLPVPDANAAANQSLYFTGIYPLQDFNASTDNPDFPSFYYNALVWNLAGQLSYEYGVPLSERAMIDKKAEFHRLRAESFDIEEGSLYLMPQWQFGES